MGKSRIGLLFVHGIGEQERFEHLRNSVREYAELLKLEDRQIRQRLKDKVEEARATGDDDAERAAQAELDARIARRISVVDRTAGWKREPGDPQYGPDARAPVTISIERGAKVVEVDCHEVWWSDLGAKGGLFEKLAFWIWGLGQWAAPIYGELEPHSAASSRHIDAVPKALGTAGQAFAAEAGGEAAPPVETPSRATAPIESLIKLPDSSAGKFGPEIWVRVRLAVAALVATLTLFSWHLFKRLIGLFADAPSTTLIFQYVGDVHTYEGRAMPNKSAVSDPGHPLRVPIRRRMVSEMVAMATRDYDRWCISAHSLGTVVAYNGLTEIAHALPNYLSEEAWNALPAPLKQDDNCLRRDDGLETMMPARPAWLDDDDVINRAQLFERFDGFLTYGSPLDKFAAIWPRIVATARDRIDNAPELFEDCCWVNLSSSNDPVSGKLDSYSPDSLPAPKPELHNVVTSPDFFAGVSHVRYFRSGERSLDNDRTKQRMEVVNWLVDDDDPACKAHDLAENGTPNLFWSIMYGLGAWIQYLVVLLLLVLGAGLALSLGDNLLSLFGISFAADSPWGQVATAVGDTFQSVGEKAQPLLRKLEAQKPESYELFQQVVAIANHTLSQMLPAHDVPAGFQFEHYLDACAYAIGAGAWFTLATGLSRWFGESWRNWRLSVFDRKRIEVRRLLAFQFLAALLSCLIALLALSVAIYRELDGVWVAIYPFTLALNLLIATAAIQALLNGLVLQSRTSRMTMAWFCAGAMVVVAGVAVDFGWLTQFGLDILLPFAALYGTIAVLVIGLSCLAARKLIERLRRRRRSSAATAAAR